MQDLLGNIISGIALEIGKPFKRGDWVIYETQRAEVIEVNWRSTRLRNNDDVYLDVPNNQIVKHAILNLSYPNKVHAERIIVGIDYNAAPNLVREALIRAAGNGFSVLKNPSPKVFLKDFADSAVLYEIKFWMERDDLYNDIMDSVRTNVWYELNRYNIKIPYPVRTLQVERRQSRQQAITPVLMDTLRKQKFFLCMDDAQIDRILASAKLLRYGRGEKPHHAGERGRLHVRARQRDGRRAYQPRWQAHLCRHVESRGLFRRNVAPHRRKTERDRDRKQRLRIVENR